MASNDNTTEGSGDSNPSDTFGSTLSEETETPPIPSQDQDQDTNGNGNSNDGSNRLDSPLAGEGRKSADRATDSISAQLEALRRKINALEQQGQAGSVTRNADEAAHDRTDPRSEHPDLSFEVEQYRRMEKVLYKHRKDWEMDSKHHRFNMGPLSRRTRRGEMDDKRLGGRGTEIGPGPWSYSWEESSYPSYNRPNLFNGSHQDIDAPNDDARDIDEFDIAIDFGAARDRIRKNFEWDMDRMFLKEEMDSRRREKITLKKAQEEDRLKGEEEEIVGGTKAETCEEPTAQLRLNPVDWFVFKRPSQLEEDFCVIDILIGEPIVNDVVRRGVWIRRQKRRVPQIPKPQYPRTTASLPRGQAPLPERIRIRSAALCKILYRILGEEASALVKDNLDSVVLVRPFKMLSYAEQSLRSWYANLEEKFEKIAKTTIEHGLADDTTRPEQGNDGLPQPDKVPEDTTTSVKQSIAEGVEVKGKEGIDGGDGDNNGSESDEEEEVEKEEDPNDITQSKTALDHLKCLLDFIDQYILAKRNYLNSPKCTKVFFSDLWHLFRPGVVVISLDGKQVYRVVNVASTHHRAVSYLDIWNPNNIKKKVPFSTTCIYIDFDGKNLGPVSKTFDFKRFEGEMDVTSLPVYPLHFHPLRRADSSKIESKDLGLLPLEGQHRQRLINRGGKFLEVVGIKPMYYAGPTLGIRDNVESQVVIDFESAFSVDDKKQQEWKPDLEVLLGNPAPEEGDDEEKSSDKDICYATCCRGEFVHDDTYVDLKTKTDYINNLLPKTGRGQNELPSVAIIPQPLRELRNGPGKNDYAILDDERVIMSYRVFGFVLRSRQWAQLDLSYLTDLHPHNVPAQNNQGGKNPQDNKEKMGYGTTAFDRLVLEEGQKSMVQALVAQHFRDKESKTGHTAAQVDIIKGKGKGLILLLHGAPGVGKTSTAEGIAELFRKPLFQITCGDLGSTAKDVERALDINFTLANRWDCILLLDEADVFLAQRNKEDFKRNGLVAVFLRVLEYYAGVLFLTTNRVGDFDEAITSRLHVGLYYPELSVAKTVRVFRVNIDMINERFKDQNRKIIIDDIVDFASNHFDTHPDARWNGRQIRNACQTALALAEFEAQGNNSEIVLKPNALVHLKVSHFQIVQKVYLEFASYMNKVYGGNSATRAEEGKVRAVWVDENAKVVGMQNMSSDDFRRSALGMQQSGQRNVQPQRAFQQQQQPASFLPVNNQGISNLDIQSQQPQQQYYPYANIVAPQPMFAQAPGQMQLQIHQQQQQLPSSPQFWNAPGANFAGGSGVVTGQGEGQIRAPAQLLSPRTPPAPQHQLQQQQQQANPALLDQNVQAGYAAGSQNMQSGYVATNPQNLEQRSLSNLPLTGGGGGSGYAPGPSTLGQQQQQWQG